MDRREYLARWSTLHGDLDLAGAPLVRYWLTGVHAVAAPLARAKVSPTAVTAFGVVVAALAWALAIVGGVWLVASAAAVLVASVVDSLDGAVAVMRRRDSAFGYVIDSVADRCSDLLFFAAMGAVGAPTPLVLIMSVSTVLQETARARSAAAGLTEIAVVTVWERPSRVITTMVTLSAVASVPDRAEWSGSIGAGVGAVLAVVGLVQFLVVARRRLAARARDPRATSLPAS